jgi:CRP/FNR family cyclic AMP-dependent transcriptional regulator
LSHASFDILQWLSAETQAALAGEVVRRRYRPGQLIYAQHDPGCEMFIVAAGAVQLSLMRKSGRQFIYCYFVPGDVFGESSLIDGDPRPQTAEAKSYVDLDVLSAASLKRIRANHRDMDDALLRIVTWKMRVLGDQVAHATLDTSLSRVAAKILENAHGFRRVVGGSQAELSLSQSDLASMLGISRQSVSKVLQRLQQTGAIGLEYGRIQIVDAAVLEGAADN